MNCSSRVNSSLTGRPVLSVANAQISSVNTSCLPPKPPPTRSLLFGDVGRLAAGADDQPLFVEPRDRAMRFEMRVLHAMRGVSALVQGVGFLESRLGVTYIAMYFRQDILSRSPDARFPALIVDDGRALAHRLFGVEDCGQQLVID